MDESLVCTSGGKKHFHCIVEWREYKVGRSVQPELQTRNKKGR
jgi:hypothetical protein